MEKKAAALGCVLSLSLVSLGAPASAEVTWFPEEVRTAGRCVDGGSGLPPVELVELDDGKFELIVNSMVELEAFGPGENENGQCAIYLPVEVAAGTVCTVDSVEGGAMYNIAENGRANLSVRYSAAGTSGSANVASMGPSFGADEVVNFTADFDGTLRCGRQTLRLGLSAGLYHSPLAADDAWSTVRFPDNVLTGGVTYIVDCGN